MAIPFLINPPVTANEEYGYLLGIICSDGTIDFKNNFIAIRMNDVVTIERVRDIANRLLSKDIQIHTYENSPHINICSKQFIQSIAELKESPKQYLRTSHDHLGFWKGMWDGDGGVSIPHDATKVGTEALIFLTVGKVELATKLHSMLSEYVAISNVQRTTDEYGGWCTIRIKIADIKRFAETIGFRETYKEERFRQVVEARWNKGLIRV